MSSSPHGVHLVGSIDLPTAEAIFEQIPALLPDRLLRIPDGETGSRINFTLWQGANFAAAPEVLLSHIRAAVGLGTAQASSDPAVSEADQVSAAVKKLQDLETHYDTAALESYAIFKQKKADSKISPHTKFQVCIPGIVNVIGFLLPSYQRAIEPLYEAALVRSLKRIQDSIPHSELAIQIDAAIEVMFIEGAGPFPSYLDNPFADAVERLSRFANQVDEGVELGFHLCYGDIAHKHFVEPKDLGLLVDLVNALQKNTSHPIQFLHVPVPKDRSDEAYFAPLQKLDWEVPELYLGLVHVNDEEGTYKRIETARKVVKDFGVATECGMGRTPAEDFESIMKILKDTSSAVKQ